MKFDMSAEAAEMLNLITHEASLPENWDAPGSWLCLVERIARYLASHRHPIDIDDVATLVTAGAMMSEMARRAMEAAKEADPANPSANGGAE